MNAAFSKENSPSPVDRCTVVVIYDDPITRARALKACDYLVSQLWKNVELDFYWWRTDFLKESNMSRAAAHYAIDADFLIVCSTGNDDLSSTLETWFESWIRERIKPEGAIIDLSSVSEAPSQSIHLRVALRELAKRGKLDYLTSDESQPHASRRTANPLSSVLPASVDRLLDHSRPPSRFGLNE